MNSTRTDEIADEVRVEEKGGAIDASCQKSEGPITAAENEARLMNVEEMGCKSLSVLHLSDLHISGTVLDEKYDPLIDDIRRAYSILKNVVVVVTGDIASHGQIDRSQDAILHFFQKLKSALGDRVKDIEIVPGNHDIDRSYILSKDSYDCALKNYLGLANRIVSIFGIRESFSRPYGTSIVDCGGRSVCFMRTDTSWFLEGDQLESFVYNRFAKEFMPKAEMDEKLTILKNSKNVRVKEYVLRQIADLADELNVKKHEARKRGSPVEIVIAVAHHPLSWLMKSSRESYADFLGSYSAPAIDIWMCGHAHNAKLHYDNDDHKSMLVLMSGVGSEEQRRAIRRYSTYHVSMTRNVCSVQVRASVSKGEYKNDDSLFPATEAGGAGYLCFPLKTKSPGSVIRLNTYQGNPRMEFYADQHALYMMQCLMDKMMELGMKLMDTTRIQYGLQRKRKKRCCVGELVATFLSRVCDDIVSAFILQNGSEDRLSDMPLFNPDADIRSIRWRTHFRIPRVDDNGNNVYRCVARSGGKVPWWGKEEEIGVHDMKWDSLIKGAYLHPRKMLVRSVNIKPRSRETAWDDYMTSILDIENNDMLMEGGKRPILTFGISSKSTNYESSVIACRFLYLLEFFNINKVVSLCVGEYLRSMSLTPSELMRKD